MKMKHIKKYLYELEKCLLIFTIKDLLFWFFTYIVIILVKLPINSLIYSETHNKIIPFLIAFMFS